VLYDLLGPVAGAVVLIAAAYVLRWLLRPKARDRLPLERLPPHDQEGWARLHHELAERQRCEDDELAERQREQRRG